jgi:Tol biopolymer transport system component
MTGACGGSAEQNAREARVSLLEQTLTDVDLCPTWSPDGTSIIFPRRDRPVNVRSLDSGGGFLTVVEQDGTGLRRLPGEVRGDDPDWSPDGSMVAYLRSGPRIGDQGDGDIAVVDLDKEKTKTLVGTPLLGGGWENGAPSWSPDGRQIVYEESTVFGAEEGGYGFDARMAIVRADGSGRRLLASPDFTYAADPAWSPDGSHIAFTTGEAVSLVAPDGTGYVQLYDLKTPTLGAEPAWSPDGKRLAFQDGGNLLVLDVESRSATQIRAIEDAGGLDFCPDWSPKGNQIAFTRSVERGDDELWGAIFLINSDGSGERQLTQAER